MSQVIDGGTVKVGVFAVRTFYLSKEKLLLFCSHCIEPETTCSYEGSGATYL